MKENNTILDAVVVGNKVRILTDTVTDYKETVACLKMLIDKANALSAAVVEFFLDSFDAPAAEIAAWLKENTDATITWNDGRFSLYEIPCHESAERTF